MPYRNHKPRPTITVLTPEQHIIAKEATKLIEAGFQYVTTIEGIQLFKKRK